MTMPAAGIPSNAAAVYQLRLLFATWFVLEASRTCDLLRYTETGGNLVGGVPPVPTLVTGLSGLQCVVSQPGQFLEAPRTATGPQLKEGEREFGFIDLPSAGGIAASTLHHLDRIWFESEEWEVVGENEHDKRAHLQNDTVVGYSFGTFRLVS